MTSLPNILEQSFSAYLSANSTAYPVFKAFSTTEVSFPAVVVKCGKMVELEAFTHVYTAEVSVAIVTQIDEVSDPLTVHDTVGHEIYSLMSSPSCAEFINSQENGHVWQFYFESFQSEKEERSLVSVLTYTVHCQGLALSGS